MDDLTDGKLRRKALKHGFVLVTMRGKSRNLVGPCILVPINSGLSYEDAEAMLKHEAKRHLH
jgi:hypothetical protein